MSKVKEWVTRNVTTGNVLTIVVVLLTTSFSLGVTYNVITDDLSQTQTKNEKQDEQIRDTLQLLNDHIREASSDVYLTGQNINDLYITRKEFDQSRTDLSARLTRIEGQLDQLIKFQLEMRD